MAAPKWAWRRRALQFMIPDAMTVVMESLCVRYMQVSTRQMTAQGAGDVAKALAQQLVREAKAVGVFDQ
jgi:hypothetical protein